MFSLFTRKHRQWGWLCRSRFLLLGGCAFSANWLCFEAINIWKMFCIWCSWILHPYLAVCGMPLFKLLCHPYNQSGWDLDGQRTHGSTFNRHYEQGTNLLDTVTMKGMARQEYKDKQDRLPGIKHFIVLTGHGHGLL